MEEEKDIMSLCLAARQHVISQLSDFTKDGRWFVNKDGLRWDVIDDYLARFGGQPGSDSVLSIHCTTARKWVPYDRGSLINIFMDLGHWSKAFYPYVTNVTVREMNLLNPFVEGLCFVSVKFCIPSPNFDSMEYQFYRFKSYMKADLSAVVDVGVHFLRSDPFSEMFLKHPSALFVRDRETRNNCSMSEVIWIESMQFPNSANSSVLELSFKASRWVDTLISYLKRAHSSFHLRADDLGDSNELRSVCIDLLDGLRNEFFSYLNIITFDVWEVLLVETYSIYHRIDGLASRDYLAIRTVSVPLCDSIVFQTLRKWTLESWSMCTDDQIMEFGAYDRSHSLALYKNLESSRYFFLVAETDGFFHALSFDVFNIWEMNRFVRSRKLPLLHPAGFLILPLNDSCCEVTIIVRREVLDGEAVEVMTNDLQFIIGRLVEFGNKFHAREEALTVINASFGEIIDKAEIPSALEACSSISKALIRISVPDFISLMMDLDKWRSFFTEIVVDAKLIDRANDFDDLTVDGVSRFEMFDADVGLPVVSFKPMKLRFGRFLKKFGGGVAVVVDISVDRLTRVPIIFDTAHVDRDICGVVVKENAGYTELIWIDNLEVGSGFQFSGKNWLSIFSQRLNRLESGLLSREISVFGQDTSVWLRLADSVKGLYLSLLRSSDIIDSGWQWEVDSTPDVRVVKCGNKSVATTTFFVYSNHDVVYNFFAEKTVQFQWPFSYYLSTVEKSFPSEDRCNTIVLHRNSVSLQGDEFLLQESSRNDCFSFVISSPLETDDVIGAFYGNVSRTDFCPSGFVMKPVSTDSSQVTLLVSRVLSDSFVDHRSVILNDVVDRIMEECYQRLGMCQAVGWPPVGAYRMNSLVNQAKSPAIEELNSIREKTKSKNTVLEKSSNGIEKNIGNAKENGHLRTSLFVKVNMDGNSIGRKVDLSVHNCYETLAQMLEEMFCKPPAVKAIRLNGEERNAMVEARRPSKLLGGSSKFVLTYQDKDGDLMHVGDVPWEMFLCSVKRLRIMRASDANGLAPGFQEMTGIQRSKSI